MSKRAASNLQPRHGEADRHPDIRILMMEAVKMPVSGYLCHNGSKTRHADASEAQWRCFVTLVEFFFVFFRSFSFFWGVGVWVSLPSSQLIMNANGALQCQVSPRQISVSTSKSRRLHKCWFKSRLAVPAVPCKLQARGFEDQKIAFQSLLICEAYPDTSILVVRS